MSLSTLYPSKLATHGYHDELFRRVKEYMPAQPLKSMAHVARE